MIKIIIAETGSQYEYPMSKFVSSTSLKKAVNLLETIEKDHSIAKENQVILRQVDGRQLEEHMNLEDFIEKECTIYVYNKVFYRQEQIDDFEVIGPLALEKKTSESVTQFLPTIYEAHLGKDVMDLIDSENKQRFHNLISVFSDVKTGIAALKEGSIKLKRQKDAEAVAKKNLMSYYGEKKKRFDDNLNSKEAKLNSLQNYINNFEIIIAKLSKIEIVPELQEENKKFLVDYFDVNKIRNSKALYEKNQVKIKQKFVDIKEELSQYDNQLKMMEENIPNQHDKLNARIQELELEFTDIHDAILDVQELKNLMEVSYNKPTKLDINEFIRVETQRALPKLKEIDNKLGLIRDEIEDCLLQNAGKLKDFITDIANLQGIIRKKIQNKMTIFETLVEKHEKDMFNFEILEKFPSVYQKSLEEIVRRNSAIKVHEEFLEIFEKYIDNENRVRQEFLKHFQDYLPKTFCPFFSKQFLPINFDNIKKILYDTTIELRSSFKSNENLSGSRNESMGFHSSSNSNQLLKLLNEANQKEKIRESEILALKQTIRKQQEDIESYSENMKTKLLTVANIRTLFGNVNYDTQFETLADALKRGLEDRVKKLEAKFNNFRLKKFAPLLETVQALRTYKSKYEASKAIIDELRKKCDDLEATKSENDVLVNHQKKEFESQFIMISELKSQLEESQANLDSLNHQCKEYENKINRLTQRLEDQKVQLETEKAALQKEIDEKRHMANDFEMEKSKLQKDLEKQTLLAEHYKSEFKKKSNELREEQEMKKTVVESLEVSIRHTSNETIKILQNDIESKNIELEKRANQIEALEKEVSQLKQELKDLSDLPQKTTLLAGENNLLKMTNDELRMKVDELKVIAGEGIKTSEELKNNKEKLEKVENELKKLEKIPELEGIIRSLEEKLIKQNVIIEEYEKENKSSLDQIHMLQSQIQLPDSEIPSYMQVLLGELGEITLDLYKTLMGESEYNRVTSKEYEVADLLSRVKKVVDTQVIRSEDYYDGCTVIAVLIQGSDQEYQIIYTALAEVKVLYLYRSEKKLKATFIKGKLKFLQGNPDPKLVDKYKEWHVIQVQIENPVTLISPTD